MTTDSDIGAFIARITRRHEEDVASGRKATSRAELPVTYESITPEWMTAVLAEDVPDARVEALRLDRADDGTSNRCRISLQHNEAGRRAGLPETVFCKASHGLQNKITFGVVGAAHTEVTFYNSIRRHLDIEAPEPYFAAYDPESFNSIIVLADLTDRVQFCGANTPVDRPRIEQMLESLAVLHARFSGDRGAEVANLGLMTWPGWWTACMRIGLEEFTDRGLQAAAEVVPPRLMARRREIWPATMQSVEAHKAMPCGLIHSDVHLKNWYLTTDGVMGLADWQCIGFGHWSRDLAYVISAALRPEDRRSWERDLIASYLDTLAGLGVPTPSLDETWLHYRQQLLGALGVWTATLTPSPEMPDMQPPADALKFIRRITTSIDDLDVLDTFKS